MPNETLMTEAATTTEGQPASNPAADSATGAGDNGQQQQPVQGQGTEGQQAAGTDGQPPAQKAEEKPQGAPEQYEFKAPEGVEFDEGVIGTFSAVAKELNLPQDQAQTVLDKMLPVMQARHVEQVSAFYQDIGGMPDTWAASSAADKEFGGDNLAENLAVAKKARDAFGSPELNTLLNKTGLGNHPEIIRTFFRAGKAISEDRIEKGQAGKADTPNAQRLYAASNMNP